MQATLKLLDTAIDRRKTLNKEKEKRKMRKSQAIINIFLLLLFHLENLLHYFWKNLVYIVTFVLQFSRVTG